MWCPSTYPRAQASAALLARVPQDAGLLEIKSLLHLAQYISPESRKQDRLSCCGRPVRPLRQLLKLQETKGSFWLAFYLLFLRFVSHAG